ncbi:MAG: hypothetical protein M3Y07_10935 [Acidobacteriota bacterium]|nr:hypothetical protein [Acidobacteriota bacterium]
MRHFFVAALTVVGASAARVHVTVYDRTNLPGEVSATAFEDVRRIFRMAGIDAELVLGDLSAAEASVMTYTALPPKGREAEAGCRARRDIALKIVNDAPAGVPGTTLGMAQPLAQTGLNVRIYDDHVREAAIRANLPHGVVLACAIAHEIGHVLLRTGTHAKWGLMSETLTSLEYQRMSARSLLFQNEESEKMRMNMGGEGCQVREFP